MSGPRVLRATLDGRLVEIDVPADGPLVLREDGQSTAVQVTPLANGDATGCLLALGGTPGGPRRATVAAVGDELWVFVDGEVFEIDVEQAQHTPTRRRAHTDGTLASPMPATVMRILVEPGQAVAAGDTLLLLEAMKMELPVRAPRAGRISAIRCKPGELVQPGIALVELE
jgi:3-methylcrotonyl-CoA carboxylase alpha subunit